MSQKKIVDGKLSIAFTMKTCAEILLLYIVIFIHLSNTNCTLIGYNRVYIFSDYPIYVTVNNQFLYKDI